MALAEDRKVLVDSDPNFSYIYYDLTNALEELT